MPEFWFNDGGAPRKAKELWFNDGAGVRKIKEAWYNDGTGVRKVFAAGAPVSLFGGLLNSSRIGAASSCSITFAVNGTVTSSFIGVVITDGAAGDSWYDPAPSTITDSFWIRATVSAGSGPSSGSSTATWLPMSSPTTWAYNSGSGSGSSRTGTLLIEISSDSGGSVIVASGSYNFLAERD